MVEINAFNLIWLLGTYEHKSWNTASTVQDISRTRRFVKAYVQMRTRTCERSAAPCDVHWLLMFQLQV